MNGPRPTVVYIGGTGRSGSTLLARVLTTVPGVVGVGELRYVLDRGVTQNHLCGCGEPFLACPFWREVIQHALPEGDAAIGRLMALGPRVDRIRYIPMLAWPRLRTAEFGARLDEYGAFLARLYSAVASVSGAALIVDSSKDPSYAFVLRSLDSIEFGLLHLVRDPRAVAFSWTRVKPRPEVHSSVAHMATRRPLRTALLWDAHHVLFELLARRSRRHVRVRYEDFAAAPDVFVTTFREAFGDGAGAEQLGAPGVVHDISGNPLRFAPEPRAIVADEEWRARMPRASRRVVTAICAPLLRRYAYRSAAP